MIKSKIDARERALELAIEWRKAMPNSLAETTASMAENFAKFLIGDAELPEVDALTNFLEKRGMALSGTPCKSTTE